MLLRKSWKFDIFGIPVFFAHVRRRKKQKCTVNGVADTVSAQNCCCGTLFIASGCILDAVCIKHHSQVFTKQTVKKKWHVWLDLTELVVFFQDGGLNSKLDNNSSDKMPHTDTFRIRCRQWTVFLWLCELGVWNLCYCGDPGYNGSTCQHDLLYNKV